MTGTINNGSRELVQFGPYSGLAGIVDLPDSPIRKVAFFGRLRDFKHLAQGIIGTDAYRVLAVEASDPLAGVEGMVVLTVQRPLN